jgi:hypothetical protein
MLIFFDIVKDSPKIGFLSHLTLLENLKIVGILNLE